MLRLARAFSTPARLGLVAIALALASATAPAAERAPHALRALVEELAAGRIDTRFLEAGAPMAASDFRAKGWRPRRGEDARVFCREFDPSPPAADAEACARLEASRLVALTIETRFRLPSELAPPFDAALKRAREALGGAQVHAGWRKVWRRRVAGARVEVEVERRSGNALVESMRFE